MTVTETVTFDHTTPNGLRVYQGPSANTTREVKLNLPPSSPIAQTLTVTVTDGQA